MQFPVSGETVAVTTKRLSDQVGVEVTDLSVEQLVDPEIGAELDALLGVHGVLVFREINVDDATQVMFSRHFGEVQTVHGGLRETPEIFVVSLDPAKTRMAEYLRGTVFWHIDGSTDPMPNKCTMLSAKAVASEGGDTEFCGTYSAYDSLPGDVKTRIDGLRVMHSFAAGQLVVDANPGPETLAMWRKAPSRVQPLVWKRTDGRKSLVLGATAEYIVDMDRAEGDALLAELEEWTTRAANVYRHAWTVGDLVVWDNRGTMHRAVPYAPTSPRLMHRTTILGDEAFL